MVSNTFASRKQRPLWELFILVAFFVGLALLTRVPAELGKLRHANAVAVEAAQARSTGN
jgi:hypothetical protein